MCDGRSMSKIGMTIPYDTPSVVFWPWAFAKLNWLCRGWSVHFWVEAEGCFNFVPPVHVQIDSDIVATPKTSNRIVQFLGWLKSAKKARAVAIQWRVESTHVLLPIPTTYLLDFSQPFWFYAHINLLVLAPFPHFFQEWGGFDKNASCHHPCHYLYYMQVQKQKQKTASVCLWCKCFFGVSSLQEVVDGMMPVDMTHSNTSTM